MRSHVRPCPPTCSHPRVCQAHRQSRVRALRWAALDDAQQEARMAAQTPEVARLVVRTGGLPHHPDCVSQDDSETRGACDC